jgi:hypothetical protein
MDPDALAPQSAALMTNDGKPIDVRVSIEVSFTLK